MIDDYKLDKRLTKKQKDFVDIYLHTTDKRIDEICAMAGINIMTGYKWIQEDEAVRDYINQQCEILLTMAQPKAIEMLIRNIEYGDTASIKYFLDMTKFKEENKAKESLKDLVITVKVD